ncbi:MAG: hypothetical protein EOM26_13890 [Alphaproteobacteria bacterium]|nr:hypothetical protein [Alphaproteobacteria bacterium]
MANSVYSLALLACPETGIIKGEFPDLSVEGVKDLHFHMLMQLSMLADQDVSMSAKWDIWEWIHDESTGPCSFRAACEIEGCDPEEVILGLHQTLEHHGIWIQRPTPLRRSHRKVKALQSAGMTIEQRMEDLPQHIGRINTPQMDLFSAASTQEEIHG